VKTTLFDMYEGPAHVWVEDPVTHYVLTELWHDRTINVIISQGKAAVLYMVRSNPDPDRYCVCGVVDRDFDADDEARWGHPECRVFRVPAHELENLLLDFDVLAALAKGDSAGRIEEQAHARAVELKWWMVHKAVLRTLQEELGAGFPGDAPETELLSSAADVEGHLRASEYWREHAAVVQRWAQGPALHDEVERWDRHLSAELAGDGWRLSFSGKEIFRHLRGHVRGLDDAPARPPDPTPSERDLNLAKRIARHMRNEGRIPPALARLHQVVRTKAGL
jgi:hypothetical protein